MSIAELGPEQQRVMASPAGNGSGGQAAAAMSRRPLSAGPRAVAPPGERVYVALLRHAAMPVMERLQGTPISSHLRELERSQWWPWEELRRLQERKLRRLVAHAYQRVPLYRQLWDEAGVRPEDVQHLEDLPRLPLVNKRVLRAAYPDQVLANGVERSQLVPYTSSGSTGEPFRFVMSRQEKGMRWAVMFRCWAWAGLEPGVPYVNLMGEHAHGALQGGWRQKLEQRLTRMLHIPAFAIHDERLEQVIEAVVRFRPRILRSYPATAHRLAQALAERGINLPLRAVLTTGEILFPFQRQAVEEQFGCPVFDAYGGDGMDVAFQCGYNSGYHINAEAVIVEVTDDEGRPLPPGQEGQLVLTNLNNLSMPFIRYAIADLGALRPTEERCPCGRGLPLLDHVSGRSSDQIVLPSGRALLMWFFTTLFRQTPGIDAFQVRQTAGDQIVISLVPNADFGHLPLEGGRQGLHRQGAFVGQEGILAYLRQRIEEQVRGEARVEIRLVDRILAGPAGKRRFFIAAAQSP